MKKTAILLAEGYEEVEGLTVVDLLRRAGIVCDMISVGDTPQIRGGHGIVSEADRLWSETDFSEYDGVILPGGLRGTERLIGDARVLELLKRFRAEGKLTAAICAGPTVLAKAGLLEGVRAACYPSVEDQLTGAVVSREPAVTDGCVITSRGMGTAIAFGLAIVAWFSGEQRARELADKIVYGG